MTLPESAAASPLGYQHRSHRENDTAASARRSRSRREQAARWRDRGLSNSVATPGQAAVLEEAVGACPRSCRRHHQDPCPRSSDAAATQSDSQRPNVALLSSPQNEQRHRSRAVAAGGS